MNRRSFLQVAGAAIASALVPTWAAKPAPLDLSPFCGDDHANFRFQIARPFVQADALGETYKRFATDAKICIAVPSSCVEIDGAARILPPANRLREWGEMECPGWRPLAGKLVSRSSYPFCFMCHGSGVVGRSEECSVCNGFGDGEGYNLPPNAKCAACEGRGVIGPICPACCGHGKNDEPNTLELRAGLHIDRHYLWKIRTHLKNVEWAWSGRDKSPIMLRFDGVCGLLMQLAPEVEQAL